MTNFPLLLPLDLWGDIGRFFGSAMEPLYTVVSAVLVFWHWLFAKVFGDNAGITWVLSIVFLTFVVRTLMIPLFVKSIQSARNMQLLQPKMAELQKKYGADRERLSQETMKLYREEGVNPMASCLPLLIQSPIFIALYTVLAGASATPPQAHGHFLRTNPDLVESLRHATFLGGSLSGKFWPMASFGPTQILALVLIIGMTVLLFITQLHMTRKNMTPESLTGPFAQQQKMMLYVFPVIYAIMGVSIPIGVLLYWFTSNLWTLVQQWIIITRAPAPNTPAYLDWEARMRAKGLDPREIERERQAKRDARRGRTATTATQETDEPATVVRQSVARQNVRRTAGRPASAPRPAGTTGSTGASFVPGRQAGGGFVEVPDDVPTVQPTPPASTRSAGGTVARQQPRKATRSVRRKGAGPTPPAGA